MEKFLIECNFLVEMLTTKWSLWEQKGYLRRAFYPSIISWSKVSTEGGMEFLIREEMFFPKGNRPKNETVFFFLDWFWHLWICFGSFLRLLAAEMQKFKLLTVTFLCGIEFWIFQDFVTNFSLRFTCTVNLLKIISRILLLSTPIRLELHCKFKTFANVKSHSEIKCLKTFQCRLSCNLSYFSARFILFSVLLLHKTEGFRKINWIQGDDKWFF